jgi:hypothetical protein
MGLSARSVCIKLIRMRHTLITFVCLGILLTCSSLLPAQTAQTAQDVEITVTGDVPTPITLHASDLAAMPRQHVEVTEEDGTKDAYDGVALQDILKKAGIPFGKEMRGKALAGYVLAEAKDGYAVLFSLGELDPDFGAAQAIVADTRDGKALFGYQGPLRLVLPADKAGARSVRMLEKLEVVKLRK